MKGGEFNREKNFINRNNLRFFYCRVFCEAETDVSDALTVVSVVESVVESVIESVVVSVSVSVVVFGQPEYLGISYDFGCEVLF